MDKKINLGRKLVRLLIFGFIGVAILLLIYFQRLPDGKLHLIFCDVGQGDAILVITPTAAQILIDGGPDDSVLSCLGKNLPFYDRRLELVILTHPQTDHMVGLVSVFENYQVENFIRTEAVNPTAEFEAFQKALFEEKTKKFIVSSGTKIHLDQDGKLIGKILWPPKDLIFAQDELNDTSIILQLNFEKFCALLTGDATEKAWFQLATLGRLETCYFLKVPHHGSKNATGELQLNTIQPKIALISAGANNRYGHPHKEVIELLKKMGVKIKRTDQDGTVEIITDGQNVQIKQQVLK